MHKQFDEEDDFYFNSDGLVVFTAEYLLQRGYCCGKVAAIVLMITKMFRNLKEPICSTREKKKILNNYCHQLATLN